MEKSALLEKMSPEGPPTRCPPGRAVRRERTLEGPPTRCPIDDVPFFRQVSEKAKIPPKVWRFELRNSKTLVTGMLNGSKLCPFTRARKALKVIVDNDPDLRVEVLNYIAGDDFKGAILSEERAAALELAAGKKITQES